MAEITALKPDPRHSARLQVFLDGRRWRVIPVAAAAGLRVGMSLDSAAQRQIEDRSSEADALQRVGRLLVERPRSEAEVRQRLERAGTAPETIDQVVRRLRRSGDLDDGSFARVWVENRMTFRPRGAALLRAELRRKGVASTEIDSALAEVDESEAAWAAVRRAAQRWASLDPFARRHKLYGFLQRRGFDTDTIRQVLHRLQAAADGDSEETL